MIFYKTVSSGNDFLHIDTGDLKEVGAREEASGDKGHMARRLCHRRAGAGADGLIFYTVREKTVDFRIFNRDGTEAELSGSGMAGLSAVLIHLRKFKNQVTLNTRVGTKTHHLLEHKGNDFTLKIEIGEPDFTDAVFFPFLGEGRAEYVFNDFTFYPVSVGNPHAVILLDKPLPEKDLERIGEMFEGGGIFPRKTNVELVQFKDAENCEVYYYERGVGPTLSSSTGSAAVFAILQKLKIIRDRLTITSGGGTINIYGNGRIFLKNNVRIVYKGNYMGW